MSYTSDVCTLIGWAETIPLYDWDVPYPCHFYFTYPLPKESRRQPGALSAKYIGCGTGDFSVKREDLPEGFIPKVGIRFTYTVGGGFTTIKIISDKMRE